MTSQAIRSIFRKVAERSCGLIELVEASDGRECVKVLSRGDIDLAFIDVYMPEMSGLEALRNARSFGIRTFVTLMSGSGSDQFMELARQLRAYEFLRKPFGVRDVESIMQTYQRVIGPTKVLIVDDSMTVRKVVQQVLKRSIFRHRLLRGARTAKRRSPTASGSISTSFSSIATCRAWTG